MSPAEKLVAAIKAAEKRVRGAGAGKWEAQCPAHEDRAASLSIGTGKEGQALVNCHAGCKPAEVVTAVGMTMADLFPPKTGMYHPTNGNGQKSRAKVWPTIEAAEVAVLRTAGEGAAVAGRWVYHADGADVAAVVRCDLPTVTGEGKQRKTFRPIHRMAGGWAVGDPPGKWPLYRLAEISGAPRVYVCEGEKAADSAASCGLAATTSAHGAKSADKTDWVPIAGCEVVLLPDHDEAGEKYIADAAAIIRAVNPAAVVKALRLVDLAGPNFPKGGDFADFSAEFRDQLDAQTVREEIEAAADRAPTLEGDSPAMPAASPASDKPSPVLTCLADVEARQVDWLWPGRVPLGRITLLVGRPGEGKSFLTTDMASRVTTGTRWPDGMFCPNGSVILISAEDDPGDTIRPRLDAHGADVRKIFLLSGVEWVKDDGERREVMFTLANLEALEESLKRLPDCRLIVVDPIGSYLGGKADANSDNEVRAVLAPVAKLAEKYGVAVLIVAHRRKGSGTNADEMALGSRAFTGIARAVWHLSRDNQNKERRLLLPGKNNLCREGSGLAFTIEGNPGGIIWEDGPVDLSADEGLASENSHVSGDWEKPGRPPEARSAACQWLMNLLGDGEIDAGRVREEAKNAGYAWGTVRRAADDLEIIREKAGFGGGWRWRLAHIAEGAHFRAPSPVKNNVSNCAPSAGAIKNDDVFRVVSEGAQNSESTREAEIFETLARPRQLAEASQDWGDV